MKCHYINTKKHGRVLIPGCWGVVHSNDIEDCYCNNNHKSLEERVSYLEDEIKTLKKLLK